MESAELVEFEIPVVDPSPHAAGFVSIWQPMGGKLSELASDDKSTRGKDLIQVYGPQRYYRTGTG